jgi:type IV fimbrial biogenesis protein FimT
MTRFHTHAGGFSLLELMITVSVAAILLGLAVPSFTDVIRNNRLTTAANDLLHSTQVARTEALKRQLPVVVCASADSAATPTPSCNGGAFTDWFVFVDTNNNWMMDAGEMVLEAHGPVHNSLTVRNDNNGIISYASSGFSNPPLPGGAIVPSRNVVICDSRGNRQIGTNSTARAIVIATAGRPRVTKDRTEVTTAIAAAGACPR